MANVLFLDFDGVIVTARYKAGTIDWQKVDLLNQIPDLQVVITSDWRLWDSLEKLTELLQAAKLKHPVIGLTPSLVWDFSPAWGSSEDRLLEDAGKQRGQEIRAWLKDHPEVEHFAIIDDLPVSGHGLGSHFVRTSEQGGLKPRHVKEIMKRFSANRFQV